MNTRSQRKYLRAVGARILSQANDLKRTPETLALELGLDLEKIQAVIQGDASVEEARIVVDALSEYYPVPLADVWVDQDDTDSGIRIMTADESIATKRIFDRSDARGKLSPYYEYRDTAMSRTGPIKPEWIQELRIVANSDPNNEEVAYNHGHLMHQTTFFVGPVNFYWEAAGQRYCCEMNTGDSNYITPFVPHSFTSRDSRHLGLIIAVTYGGEVSRALSDFERIGTYGAGALVADPRKPDEAFTRLLDRQRIAESLTHAQLVDRLVETGITKRRAISLVKAGGATAEEINVIAQALFIRPADLTTSPLESDEEVVVRLRGDAKPRLYPTDEEPAYQLTEMARTKHQPFLKGFDVLVLNGNNGEMQHSLHEYAYNYGRETVRIVWNEGQTATLAPNDSVYVQPGVKHRFELNGGTESGNLVLIRVPGAINTSTVAEFSAFPSGGRTRVTGETMRWF